MSGLELICCIESRLYSAFIVFGVAVGQVVSLHGRELLTFQMNLLTISSRQPRYFSVGGWI